MIALGQVDQRHADLLAAAAPEVMEAYVRGIERLVAGGGDPGRVSSVASFFVSRVDTEADKRLEGRGHADLRASSRSRTPSSRTRTGRRSSPATLGGTRGQGRVEAVVPVGVDLDEEPGVPRRALRRRPDRPRHREHDARGDDPGIPGSRRGRATLEEGVDEARALFDQIEAAGVTSTTSPGRSRRRACRSSPTRSTSCSTGSAPSAESWSPPRSSQRSWSSGSGSATRPSGPARTRRTGSAGSTSRCGCASGSARSRVRGGVVGEGRRRRPARDGRLVARAGGPAARVRSRAVPRARHDAPEGDPPACRRARSLRTLFVVSSKSGSTLETRSHYDFFWERGKRGDRFVAVTDPGSALEKLARERGSRRLLRRADDRRPLLGALDVRAASRRR